MKRLYTNHILGEPSETCAAESGYCGDPDKCPGNNVVHNKCPGGQDNKCCLSIPFQEAECEAEGGTCGDKCGCEGEVLHGFCPSQPNSIKCCKVPETTTKSATEDGITTAASIEECLLESTTPANCPGGANTNCNNGVCTVTCSGNGSGTGGGGGINNNNNGGGSGEQEGNGGGSGGTGGAINCPGGYNTNCYNGKCTVTCSGGNNNNNNNNGRRRRRRKRSTGLLCESETIPPLTTITTTTTITSTTTTTTTDSLSKSILVTAYTNCSLCGFLVGENNPAELVLKSLSNEIDGYTIIKEFVPVKYSYIMQTLPAVWKREKTIFIVSLGVHSSGPYIRMETQASNFGYVGDDEDGLLPAGGVCISAKNGSKQKNT